MQKINEHLHEDSRILKAIKMPDKHEAIEIEARWACYEAVPLKKDLKKNEITGIIENVLAREKIFIERTNKKGLKKQIDVRKSIDSINLIKDRDYFKIKFVLKATNSNSDGEEIPILRADDFINLIFPDTDWNITRVNLTDENKKVLL